jgi:hypothetical protein
MESDPTGLDVDDHGRVYIALNGQHEVIRLVPNAGTWVLDITFGISGKIGGLGTGDGQFTNPWDVGVVGNEFLAVSDAGNNRIQIFTQEGNFVKTEGQLGSGPGDLNQPLGIAVTSDRLTIADSGNHRIVRMSVDGSLSPVLGGFGSGPGEFQNPVNLDFGIERFYVVDQGNNRVQIFDTGFSSSKFEDRTDVPLGTVQTTIPLGDPRAVAVFDDNAASRLFIADTANDRVVLVDFPLESPAFIWEQFKTELRGGNVERAVALFAPEKQEAYRGYFIALGPAEMEELADDFPLLEQVQIFRSDARFALVKLIEGEQIEFPVLFVRVNGEWRIGEF